MYFYLLTQALPKRVMHLSSSWNSRIFPYLFSVYIYICIYGKWSNIKIYRLIEKNSMNFLALIKCILARLYYTQIKGALDTKRIMTNLRWLKLKVR